MTGNCLMGSRPLLVFDSAFDKSPELRLVKALFKQVFAVPRGHPKSKPFVDHIMSFFFLDGRIWIRNYQISERGHDEHEHLRQQFYGEDALREPQLHLARAEPIAGEEEVQRQLREAAEGLGGAAQAAGGARDAGGRAS